MPIVSDPSGVISTEDRTQQHTEWPCVPDGHAAEVSCEDAIAAWARRNGTRVLTPDSADPQGNPGTGERE